MGENTVEKMSPKQSINQVSVLDRKAEEHGADMDNHAEMEEGTKELGRPQFWSTPPEVEEGRNEVDSHVTERNNGKIGEQMWDNSVHVKKRT